MTDIHQLPDEEHVQREASAWIARLNAEDVSPDERTQFQAWKAAHPRHARAYEDLHRTWSRFTAAGPLVRAVSFAQSMNEALPDEHPSAGGRWTLATAASLVAIAALLCTAWIAYTHTEGTSSFATAIGEHSTISLSDGSTLELNSDSRARVEYSGARRVIRLDRGEAFFRVIHDARRPFWVVTAGSWVRDVGTAFNVDVRQAGVRVTVSEGTVQIGKLDPVLDHLRLEDFSVPVTAQVTVLTAGQQADVRGAAAETRQLSAAQLARSVAWRNGTLYFDNQPLGDVIQELRRYTPLELVVASDRLRALPVGGTFQANPQGAEALLEMLEQGFGLTVHRVPGRVVIEDHRDPLAND